MPAVRPLLQNTRTMLLCLSFFRPRTRANIYPGLPNCSMALPCLCPVLKVQHKVLMFSFFSQKLPINLPFSRLKTYVQTAHVSFPLWKFSFSGYVSSVSIWTTTLCISARKKQYVIRQMSSAFLPFSRHPPHASPSSKSDIEQFDGAVCLKTIYKPVICSEIMYIYLDASFWAFKRLHGTTMSLFSLLSQRTISLLFLSKKLCRNTPCVALSAQKWHQSIKCAGRKYIYSLTKYLLWTKTDVETYNVFSSLLSLFIFLRRARVSII